MNKKTIEMLDIVYFLVSQHQYEQVKLSPHDEDFWLYNRNHEKFSIIRLTTESMLKYKENKDTILTKAKKVGDLFNQDVDLLNIHFTDEDVNLFFEPGYYQAQVNETVISPMLVEQFPRIKTALLPVGDNLEQEMKMRQMRFEEFNKRRFARAMQKTQSKKKKFTFGLTHGIIIVNVLFFAVGLFITYQTNRSFSSIFMGALYKPLVYGNHEWWRIITAGFVHGDYLHLLVNMIALFQVGMLVEKVFGKKQMAFIYVIGLITSSLLVLANENPYYVTLGASGAIFGLMGAVIVYLFSSGLYKVPAIRRQIITTLAVNLIISFLPGISMYGHFGGLIGGALAALVVSKANSVKSAVIPAIISLSFVIVGLFGYTIALDQKLYPLNKDLDKLVIAGYYVLGFENRAEKLLDMYTIYYNKVGETFKFSE